MNTVDRPLTLPRRSLGIAAAALALSARRPARAQAASGAPIPIGLCASLTSQFAQNGKWMREGVELAVKQVNEAGGIGGRPLKLFVEDDGGVNPTGAVNAVTKLVTQNNVVAVIGPHYTPNILAVGSVLSRYAVPGLSGATGPAVTQGGNKFIFRVRLNDTVGAKLLVQYLTGDRNWNKIAVAYVNTAFGQGGFAAVKAELDAENKPPVAVQTHLDSTKDFTPQLLAIKNAGADSVIIWTDDQPMGLMLKQIKTLGLGFGVAGNAGLTLPNVLQLAGDAANGAYSVSEFIATDPSKQDWVRTYTAAYGAAPELYGSVYHDAAKLVAHALTQANEASGAAVQAALAQTKDFNGMVTSYTAAPNGDLVHSALITRNENEAPVIIKAVHEQG